MMMPILEVTKHLKRVQERVCRKKEHKRRSRENRGKKIREKGEEGEKVEQSEEERERRTRSRVGKMHFYVDVSPNFEEVFI